MVGDMVGDIVGFLLGELVVGGQVVTAHQFTPPLVVFPTGFALNVQPEKAKMAAALK